MKILRLKKVAEKDILEIYSLMKQLTSRPEEKKPLSQKYIDTVVGNPRTEIWILRDEDKKNKIIGIVSLFIMQTPFTKSGRIEDMVVDLKYRDQKFGKQLLERLIDRAEELKLAYLDLTSNSRRGKAHEFYERFGFKLQAGLKIYRFKCGKKKKLGENGEHAMQKQIQTQISKLKTGVDIKKYTQEINFLMEQLSSDGEILKESYIESVAKNPDIETLVLRDESKIIAMASLLTRRTLSRKSGRIEYVVVDLEYQDQGFDKQLLESLLTRAEELKLSHVDFISESFRKDTHRLCKGIGFEIRESSVYRLLLKNAKNKKTSL